MEFKHWLINPFFGCLIGSLIGATGAYLMMRRAYKHHSHYMSLRDKVFHFVSILHKYDSPMSDQSYEALRKLQKELQKDITAG